MSAKENIMT